MTKYDGRRIDGLHAINGPDGAADAYKKGLLKARRRCYAGARGQQLMAELLLQTGLVPIRRGAAGRASISVAERLVRDPLATAHRVAPPGAPADVQQIVAGPAVDRPAAEVRLDLVVARA